MDATRYPLSWPFGWKRTAARERKPTTFTETKHSTAQHHPAAAPDQLVTRKVPVSFGAARGRLWAQLAYMGVQYDEFVLSTNVQLNSVGQPRADRRTPDDPGVAVYFELNGKARVLACDKWDSVAGNMAAIANHIDALRRVDRYGVGSLDQAFAGYDALPPPSADNRPPWRLILGITPDVPCTPEIVRFRYTLLAKEMHPDLGGSHDGMAMLNAARDAALQELGA